MGLFKPKKYNFHTANARFEYDEEFAVIVGSGGFEFCDGYSILHVCRPEFVDNFNFYTHEFSEMALLGAIRKCTRKWRRTVQFKGFSKVDPSHLISPCGYPNKCTMFPDPTIRKVYKGLMYRLTPEEKALRIIE